MDDRYGTLRSRTEQIDGAWCAVVEAERDGRSLRMVERCTSREAAKRALRDVRHGAREAFGQARWGYVGPVGADERGEAPSLRHLTAAMSTAISALLARLGLDRTTIAAAEIDAVDGELELHVDRDPDGEWAQFRIEQIPALGRPPKEDR